MTSYPFWQNYRESSGKFAVLKRRNILRQHALMTRRTAANRPLGQAAPQVRVEANLATEVINSNQKHISYLSKFEPLSEVVLVV